MRLLNDTHLSADTQYTKPTQRCHLRAERREEQNGGVLSQRIKVIANSVIKLKAPSQSQVI